MTLRTIDDAVLHTEQATAYLDRADRRIVIGFRAALEMLSIPVPDAADRKPVGRKSAAQLMQDFDRDNPERARTSQQARDKTKRDYCNRKKAGR